MIVAVYRDVIGIPTYRLRVAVVSRAQVSNQVLISHATDVNEPVGDIVFFDVVVAVVLFVGGVLVDVIFVGALLTNGALATAATPTSLQRAGGVVVIVVTTARSCAIGRAEYLLLQPLNRNGKVFQLSVCPQGFGTSFSVGCSRLQCAR